MYCHTSMFMLALWCSRLQSSWNSLRSLFKNRISCTA